jgi:hypothetical protein
MSENADLYVQRYNMLLETVRVFSITLDQEYGALLGGPASPSENITEHNNHHANHMTNMGMVLVEQLRHLRQLIEEDPELHAAFNEARNLF